ncbi:hypothetical protein [Bradyrhizobium sp. 2S1]|uniref:hypothetical protein n=1 Tax=Bradyrhizobium sp. 2S1 TaxID=1404429 RepID=UPI001AED7F94|nr:hypothetical protein [Bradyrhizobium sp. 2S1]MCK7668287.1 hypothetical protein [Bradyrhizobium sp. 2S1]
MRKEQRGVLAGSSEHRGLLGAVLCIPSGKRIDEQYGASVFAVLGSRRNHGVIVHTAAHDVIAVRFAACRVGRNAQNVEKVGVVQRVDAFLVRLAIHERAAFQYRPVECCAFVREGLLGVLDFALCSRDIGRILRHFILGIDQGLLRCRQWDIQLGQLVHCLVSKLALCFP